MLSLQDTCYLAGLIDGEGCIYIHQMPKIKGARGVSYALRLQVGMTAAPVIYWLRDTFGGSVQTQNRVAPRKPCYIWCMYGAKAAALLQEARPYLKAKLAEADLAIEFASVGFSSGAVAISDETAKSRESLYLRMRELKRVSYPGGNNAQD